MLGNFSEMLGRARSGAYAVPAFDVSPWMIRPILDTASRLRSPVILMLLPCHLHTTLDWEYSAGLIKQVSPHYRIPIGLHLDHATGIEQLRQAVEFGFTSVMFDGSNLPLAENIKLSKTAFEIAQSKGVALEAELGHVGGLESLDANTETASELTDPEELAIFIEQTGVAALAVSVGNDHGRFKACNDLDISLLKRLNAISRVPLVLHGGSGTSEKNFSEAVKNGVSKVNVFAACRSAMRDGLKISNQNTRPDPWPEELMQPILEELNKVVEAKINLFGSAGKA